MGTVARYDIPHRWRKIIAGEIDISTLDSEELRRGQLRDKNGNFSGTPPKFVPREFILAMQQEGFRRHVSWVNETVSEAEKTIVELMKSRHLQPGDATRLKAAELILERYAGKVPDRVEMKVEDSRFEKSMAGAEIVMDIEEDDDNFSR